MATVVLARVAGEGAYASAALDAEISRARLDARDAALATEIVYGTLRALPALDAVIARHVSRADREIEPYVRAAMRVAAYQLLHLSRVPPYAAVDEGVSIVRAARGPKLAGFVNAVLRKVARDRPTEPAPPRALVVEEWLGARLRDSLGPERAERFLEARPLPPPLGLRVSVERAAVETVAEAIAAARPDAEVWRGTISPRCVLVRGAGDPRLLPGYEEGLFTVQEEGSQAIALLAGVAPGERVVDACAGRGGKTTLLAELAGSTGRVVAVDLYEEKLARIATEVRRLGLDPSRIETHAIDLTVGTGPVPEHAFDRVLVDAPCTGIGTIHRRPEIMLRLAPDAPGRMADLQTAIVLRAARWVKAGGLLVYAVCSPLDAEGRAVAERVERASPSFVRARDELSGVKELTYDADAVLRIGPWSTARDVDAYQVVSWRMAHPSRP